ncbi:MAG TPA: (2Fe-2S)-binding protein [Burkholderiaceae bacterium]|nr:(2Fe-2S)-binding protein [Burkholderiaceae bacterium]
MMEEALFQPTLVSERPRIEIRFNGTPLEVPAGTSVAAALLVSGVAQFRTTPVGRSSRAPWCMMGVCFDCLLEIDGKPNVQGCMTAVKENMDVRTQWGAARYE